VDQDGARPKRLMDRLADAGLLGDVLIGSVVCAIAAFVLLAFRVHPVITAPISTGLILLSAGCLYRLSRRARSDQGRWRVAIEGLALVAVALAAVAITFLSHCSCA
jgi:uncharacterized membrane protein HdeD (DUF308 family)